MNLREAIDTIPMLGRLVEQMQTLSAPGRRELYASPWLTKKSLIDRELDANSQILSLYNTAPEQLETIQRALMEMKEIRGTIARLKSREVLDDIELFELKAAALTATELRRLLLLSGVDCVEIPDLSAVVDLLDPQHTRVPHFFIYDIYSPELAAVRAQIRALDANTEAAPEGEREKLFLRSLELEDEVRRSLSEKLYTLSEDIERAAAAAARLDLIQARAEMARRLGCCRPDVRDGGYSFFLSLFNPAVREILRSRCKEFQPIDVALTAGPTVITGANMAGKSVLLKTVALAQALTQFGFFTPAAQAVIVPVEKIMLAIGDEQSELTGLSSFGSEMLRIDEILRTLRAGMHVLILIDEPARTTNPVEGKAIVDALLRLLAAYSSPALVATHYSGLTAPCRRLRVRGFIEEKCPASLSVGDINEFIDYSLVEESEDVVPREALRIARLLGVDEDLLRCAESIISTEQT